MTPIAHRLVKQRMRMGQADDGRLNSAQFPVNLSEMRCFDCTAVSDLAYDLSDSMFDHARVPDRVAFLPAPITWIEYMMRGSGKRVAIWLIDEGDGWARCGMAASFTQDEARSSDLCAVVDIESILPFCNKVLNKPIGHVQLAENVDKIGINLNAGTGHLREDVKAIINKTLPDDVEESHMFLIYAFLAIINTPRIVGRKSHSAHKGLEREMNLRVPAKTRTKLPEWTEIVLEVGRPCDAETGEGGDILTGKRALHFCRSFIRVRLGKLELVRSHWRGDAELGVRQASYKVKPNGILAA